MSDHAKQEKKARPRGLGRIHARTHAAGRGGLELYRARMRRGRKA
jgi:hypothetical protein